MSKFESFTKIKTITLPDWVKAVRFTLHHIDGYAPGMPDELTIDEFIEQATELQMKDGCGEWAVLAYGIANPGVNPTWISDSYGYDFLRSNKQQRCKLLCQWSYMRWTFFRFEKDWSCLRKENC